jgi:hypothetical protein
MIWNGDCRTEGCEREAVDSSGYCKKHKPTGEWTADSVLKIAITETHDGAQAIADAHNAALAAEYQRALQTARLNYEGLLAAERDANRGLYIESNERYHKLEEARKLLFAVQPFCQAWACFGLADDIKDFLDGRTKEPPPLHYKD